MPIKGTKKKYIWKCLKKEGRGQQWRQDRERGGDIESDLLIQISGKWELNLAQSLELRV